MYYCFDEFFMKLPLWLCGLADGLIQLLDQTGLGSHPPNPKDSSVGQTASRGSGRRFIFSQARRCWR